jgi:hypothetical protein
MQPVSPVDALVRSQRAAIESALDTAFRKTFHAAQYAAVCSTKCGSQWTAFDAVF